MQTPATTTPIREGDYVTSLGAEIVRVSNPYYGGTTHVVIARREGTPYRPTEFIVWNAVRMLNGEWDFVDGRYFQGPVPSGVVEHFRDRCIRAGAVPFEVLA